MKLKKLSLLDILILQESINKLKEEHIEVGKNLATDIRQIFREQVEQWVEDCQTYYSLLAELDEKKERLEHEILKRVSKI